MEERKNPRIPEWKKWILVITAIQALSAIQSYRIHQNQWMALNEQSSLLKQHIENSNQHLKVWNQSLENFLEQQEKGDCNTETR